MALTVGAVSLGCNKNRVDTESALGLLRDHGFQITADPAKADILLVNTCGFILSAREESINTILEMAEFKKPVAAGFLWLQDVLPNGMKMS